MTYILNVKAYYTFGNACRLFVRILLPEGSSIPLPLLFLGAFSVELMSLPGGLPLGKDISGFFTLARSRQIEGLKLYYVGSAALLDFIPPVPVFEAI